MFWKSPRFVCQVSHKLVELCPWLLLTGDSNKRLSLSKLQYSSTVWSNTWNKNICRLQSVQNFTAEPGSLIIKISRTPTLRDLRWLPVKQNLFLLDAVISLKYMSGQASPHWSIVSSVSHSCWILARQVKLTSNWLQSFALTICFLADFDELALCSNKCSNIFGDLRCRFPNGRHVKCHYQRAHLIRWDCGPSWIHHNLRPYCCDFVCP